MQFARLVAVLFALNALAFGGARAAASAGPDPVKRVTGVLQAQATPAAAPRLVAVSGTVLGADGLPKPGVSVFVAGAPHQPAVTNADGAFVLQVPARRHVQLVADYAGLGQTRAVVDGRDPQPLFITVDGL